ncbi:MAG: hypothetical protein AB1486_25160 [Planctomycetota bacterium]
MPRVLVLSALLLVSIVACETVPPVERSGGYADMIAPTTSPFYFESPLIQDEIRPVGMYHAFPETGVLQGGEMKVYALQARVVVDQGDTALFFNKFGVYDINASGPDADDAKGWADFGLGLKHSLIREPDAGFIFTVGLGYESDQGSDEVLQGHGEGIWNPFVSAAQVLGDFNLMASTGALLSTSSSRQSSIWHYHLHVDRAVTPDLYPFVEFNGYTVFDEGHRVPGDFEGGDLFDLGASESHGDDLITAGPGLRYRTDVGDLGIAYEFPLTDSPDFFDWRLTIDFMIQL